MALAVVITPGATFPAGKPITLAALRKGAIPSVSISGSVGSGDISPGAVNPTHIRPDAYFFDAAPSFASNTFVATLSPALTAMAAGVSVRFKAGANITGATSLNVNALGSVLIKKNASVDLAAGDIRNGQIVEVRHDGTFWQMMSELGNVSQYFQGTDSGTANTYVLALAPAPAALADITGKPIRFIAANTNTGASTLAINALAATAIKKNKDQALAAGDIKAGQIVEVAYDGTAFQWYSLGSDTAVVAASRGLTIQPNNSTPSSKVDIAADMVVLQTSGNRSYLATTVAVTVDITADGAGGLDAGHATEAASTWYYVWLIYDGTTLAGMLSVSSTAPTMPTGYIYKALVGAVRNNGSSNFVNFWQTGRDISFVAQDIFTAKIINITFVLLSGGDLTNFRAAVPPIAVRVTGTLGGEATSHLCLNAAADTSGLGGVFGNAGSGTSSAFGYSAAAPFSIPLKTNNLAVQSDNSASSRLSISGYTI